MRDLAQALVEREEPGMDVVEASAHTLTEVGGHDCGDLRRRSAHFLGQRHELLQRAVVQVEAEAQQTSLAGSDEIVLSLHPAIKKGCAFEDRRERCRSLLEVFLQMLRLRPARSRDERRVRPVPALHHPDVNLRGAGDDPVERGARHLAEAAAARRLAMGHEAGRRAGCVENPKRACRGGCELDEQRERELGGDRRRKLGEPLASESATEDRERRSLGRQPDLVGGRDHRGPGLACLELVVGRDRDDRVTEEVERGTLTPAVG